MPDWLYPLSVMIPAGLVLLVSLALVVVGVSLMMREKPTPVEEISVDVPKPSFKASLKVSGGALLVIVGLASAGYVLYQYPKMLLVAAAIVAAGGASQGGKRKNGKHRSPPKRRRPSKNRRSA